MARFKMPGALKSPSRAKTRARRLSVYQKGEQNLLSPRNLPVSSRTRRSSIYMRGTNIDTEFSKVFRTPVKPVDPVKTITEEVVVVAGPVVDKKPKLAARKVIQTSPSLNIQKKRSPVLKISPLKNVLSPVKLKKTPDYKLKSPKVTRSARKTPKSATMKTSELETPFEVKATTKATRSARKSVKKSVQSPDAVASPKSSIKLNVTSKPSKTVEEITNKLFYGTPQETTTRNNDLIVFSAKPVSSIKPRERKITVNTPKVKSTKTTPTRMPARKTPAIKRQLIESDDDSTPIESKTRKLDKRVQSSKKKDAHKANKCEGENKNTVIIESNEEMNTSKLKLSPVEMISVLKSVHEEERQEKRKAEEAIDQRPLKIAKLTGHHISTPRLMKMAKRVSPKKLAEIAERREIQQEEWRVVEADNSFLNDTVNSDSRSSRCIIL